MSAARVIDLFPSSLQRAHELGLRLISYDRGRKFPKDKGWPSKPQESLSSLSLDSDRKNYGTVTGHEFAPGRFLADVDVDWIPGASIVREFMPRTRAEFGRATKPLSHLLFATERPLKSAAYRDVEQLVDGKKKRQMLLELRGTDEDGTLGHQTMIPPSVHPDTSELLSWAERDWEPSEVEADFLQARVRYAASAILIAKYWPGSSRHELRLAYARVLLDLGLDASQATQVLEAACRAGGSDEAGVADVWTTVSATRDKLEEGAPATGAKTVAEILPDVGGKIVDRLREWHADPDLGDSPDLLDPRDPMKSARVFIASDNLVHQGGVFYRWHPSPNAWLQLEESVVRAEMWKFLEASRRPGSKGAEPFKPNKGAVGEVVDAARALSILPASQPAPRWRDGRQETTELIAFPNGLLRTSDRVLLPPDPAFFNHVALPFAFAPEAREAGEWNAFLRSIWPDDPESIATLQEMFGCLVSGATKFQKIWMIVGPKRSGKGTIARIVRELLGRENVCGPTLASLAETFGRQNLIDKSAAIISDARITSRTDTALVAENLLRTSGEDAQEVQRKYLPAWNGQLRVRFLLLTNELPRMEDASGALASRFVILRMTRSFYGEEDLGLFDRLTPELPAILNWALDGWDRLRKRGHFAVPKSSADLVAEFEDLGSPISAFLRDCCDVGEKYTAPQPGVFDAWRSWCEQNGRQYTGTSQSFAKDLRAALPHLNGDGREGSRGKQVRVWKGLRLRMSGQATIDEAGR